VDACDAATGACAHPARDCDDGDPCTVDACDAATGACAHPARDCDDGVACTVDSCDAATGACRHDESGCVTPERCDNAADDDGDGLTDCDDLEDCADFAACSPACAADPLEENDRPLAATAVTPDAQWSGLTAQAGDEDWFAIPLCTGGTLHATATFLHAQGDIDLYLSLADGQTVAWSVSLDDDELLEWTADRDGTAWLLVQLYVAEDEVACNGYGLGITFDDSGCAAPAEDCTNDADDDTDGQTDCDDADCEGHPACAPPPETLCANEADDDADGLTDCDDADCAGDAACAPPPPETLCANQADDDADGLTDCDDADCAGHPACLPPVPETACANDVDDDADGWTDCADADCQGDPACARPPESVCDDGVDEDGDGLVDCDDADCLGAAPCLPPAPETVCDDGADDDADGLTDCDDSDCDGALACRPPAPETNCDNGADDDGDGVTDCDDVDCDGALVCLPPAPETNCDNGADDDADGLVDCADADCAGAAACLPSPVEAVCDDEADDDADGLTDCDDADCDADPACQPALVETDCDNDKDDDADGLTDCDDVDDCAAAPPCTAPPEDCGDGVDNDGDGRADCDDPDCAAAAGCACVDDAFEDDDAPADATLAVPTAFYPDLVSAGGDDDWFAVEVCARGLLVARAVYDGTAGALELAILAADGSVHAAGAPTADGRRAAWRATGDGTVYVRVSQPNAAACLPYALGLTLDRTECVVATPESCADGLDNDADGAVDCDDADCALDPACGACADDANEDDDGPLAATPVVTPASWPTLVANDEDWFAVEACTGGLLVARVTFDRGAGALDLSIVAADGTVHAAGAPTAAGSRAAWSATLDGTAYVRVRQPAAGACLPYGITITLDRTNCDVVRPEVCTDGRDNDGDGAVDCDDPDCADVHACFAAVCGEDDAYEENDSRPAAPRLTPNVQLANLVAVLGDADWFRVPVCTGGALDVLASFTHALGNIELTLTDEDGRMLLRSADADDDEQLAWTATYDGSVYVRVHLFNDPAIETTCNVYDLAVSFDDTACSSAIEDCFDDADNDGDGLIDCEDPDCSGTVAIEGACTNPADLRAVAEVDIVAVALACVLTEGCRADAACSAACVAEATDASEGCSACGGQLAACIAKQCLDACGRTPNSVACRTCLDTSCWPAWDVCFGTLRCPLETDCQGGGDDDGDGLVDCADPDCAAVPPCVPAAAEVCDDGADNDGDGAFDCADADCAADPFCTVGCADDGLEDNDERATGTPVTLPAAWTGLTSVDGDDDWFVIPVCDGGVLTVSARFPHANGDIDLYLYDAEGVEVARSWSGSDDEAARWTSNVDGGVALVVRMVDAGACNTYDLTIDLNDAACGATELCHDGQDNDGDGLVDCDDDACANAPACFAADCGGDDAYEENDLRAQAAEVTPDAQLPDLVVLTNDADWFRVPVCTGGSLAVGATFEHALGDIDLALVDPRGRVLLRSQGAEDGEHLAWTVAEDGVLFVRVYLFNDPAIEATCNVYDLAITLAGCGGGDPEDCFDEVDNDGDGLADCLDPDCSMTIEVAGACTTETDLRALAAVELVEAASTCSTACATELGCSATCMAEATGVSAGCSLCGGGLAVCIGTSCGTPCTNPSSMTCQNCLTASCWPAYDTCAGTLHCGFETDCRGGGDEDGDGLVNCADPDCAGVAPCP
jgi:hypothetical protein